MWVAIDCYDCCFQLMTRTFTRLLQFSVLYTSSRHCYQLFLGPGRFVNVGSPDYLVAQKFFSLICLCPARLQPKCGAHPLGQSTLFQGHSTHRSQRRAHLSSTHRYTRLTQSGAQELLTYYGNQYFGPNNENCLCLTCKK